MRRLWLLSFAVLSCWAAQRGEGRHSRQQPEMRPESGSIPLPGGRLKVLASGAVVVRGQERTDAAFSIRSRGMDPDSVSVRTYVRGAWTVLQVVSPGEPEGPRLELNLPKSLNEVNVTSQGGSVEIYDIAGSVQADTRAGKVQFDRIGTNARAVTGGGPIRIGTVSGTLRCMSGGGAIQVDRAGGETWCESAGGEIYIGEANGPLHATTAGNIQIGRARSSVWARSGGGLIEVNEAGGAVIAQTTGGSIQVGSSKGLACESAAGAIRVKSVGGPLRAYTASGSILAEILPGVRLDESSLSTSRGDITVFLPSNISVSVEASNQPYGARGRIVSDFPEIRIRSGPDRSGPITAAGALNGGGPVLRIHAVGNIYLRRQK